MGTGILNTISVTSEPVNLAHSAQVFRLIRSVDGGRAHLVRIYRHDDGAISFSSEATDPAEVYFSPDQVEELRRIINLE